MQSEWAAKIFGDRVDPRKRLQAVFGGTVPSSGQPPETALSWARGVLAGAPSAAGDVVGATRELRRAEPRLTLKAATFLARHAVSAA
ncbi:hypothetical protein R8Z57_02460 [Microbacterium sp. M3]|jgi:hypothetical protein|uniref:Uncharacterized protein n=1 Tax=Microbacterium arthrosphaerae TaxID=792652 RepID=A0ABU4GYU7_9MICO|nr:MULTISPECIES: hypothetical protein [Microbacterium]MDW4571634.1 hypothetical protein [Microbacterium arthrosphaerae]MDW7605489.1 hypothetical protein [Microbacterium sp. M3]